MFANPSRQWKQIHVQRKIVTDWTYKEDNSLLKVTESINEVNYKFVEVGLIKEYSLASLYSCYSCVPNSMPDSTGFKIHRTTAKSLVLDC